MSDTIVDNSKTGIAARAAVQQIMAGLESRGWESIDGPFAAYFHFREEEGDLNRRNYISWSFAGPKELGARLPWTRDVKIIPDLFLDNFDADADSDSIFPHGLGAVSPETHKIVWRYRPELEYSKEHQRWTFYCRFTMVPKGAEILPYETDAK